MKNIRTVSVPRSEIRQFTKRAEECFQLAEMAHAKKYWLGTCINAVHSAIALADCLCIVERGLRYAGANHDEAVELYSSLQLKDEGFGKSIQNFGRLISIKHHAEYTGKSLNAGDAESISKALGRFREFVFKNLPQME